MIAELKSYAELAAEVARLRVLVSTDELTGCLNRRGIMAELEQQMARAQRHSQALGILALDLDHFKTVNDTRGHLAGDEVLRLAGAALRTAVRRYDRVGRTGGDEFLVILPHGYSSVLSRIGERIAKDVKFLSGVSVSVGGHTVTAQSGETPARAIETADQALYLCKRRESRVVGRNGVGLVTPEVVLL